MNILVIGGTIFLGRHIIENAVTRGHTVTAFFRGRHADGLHPQVTYLRGDRTADVSALAGRTFDAVIDTCGYHPDDQRLLVEVLAPSDPHYVFISTISVYAGFPSGRVYDESAPVLSGAEGYGPAKARSEEVIREHYAHTSILRPGLIVGPHDPTGRFTYWPVRVSEGGTMLAPGDGSMPVQFVDARDVAAFAVRCAEDRVEGTFNVTGPHEPLTIASMLHRMQQVLGSDPEIVWMSDDDLIAAGVTPWKDLPLWIPPSDPDAGGMALADISAARSAGLTLRSLEDTTRDLMSWYRSTTPPAPHPMMAPITRERETEILRSV
jgi:2'-hydroxyisoflavone reductase